MKRLAPLRDTQRVSSQFEHLPIPCPLKCWNGWVQAKDQDFWLGTWKPCPHCREDLAESMRIARAIRRDRILYIAICCALTVLGLGLAGALYLVLTRI